MKKFFGIKKAGIRRWGVAGDWTWLFPWQNGD